METGFLISIINFLHKAYGWIKNHIAELLISGVYVISYLPFFISEQRAFIYGIVAATLAIISAIIRSQEILQHKAKTFYEALSVGILLATVIILCRHYKDIAHYPVTHWELFRFTYITGAAGLISGAILVEIIYHKRKKP